MVRAGTWILRDLTMQTIHDGGGSPHGGGCALDALGMRDRPKGRGVKVAWSPVGRR